VVGVTAQLSLGGRAPAAVVSACGLYRYRLTRPVVDGDDRRCLFVMVNPSTADASADDATIRKCVGFTRRWGYGWLDVVNLFAWRSTDVRALPVDVATAVGPDNDRHIRDAVDVAATVVLAWGDRAKIHRALRGRIEDVLAIVLRDAPRAVCLGRTKGGDPNHPLMLGYATERAVYMERL
jgi:hypothetical protein